MVDEVGAHEGDNNPLVIYVCEITGEQVQHTKSIDEKTTTVNKQ